MAGLGANAPPAVAAGLEGFLAEFAAGRPAESWFTPERADELGRLLERGGRELPAESGPRDAYAAQLRRLLPELQRMEAQLRAAAERIEAGARHAAAVQVWLSRQV